MVHIYYHIYAVADVDKIVNEQLSLIEKHFNFPYILNVGICIADDRISTANIIKKLYDFNKPNYRLRNVGMSTYEFITLDLIKEDGDKFGDTDYILYIHTKGSSKMNESYYQNLEDWRQLMQYFLIEKCNDVFKIFEVSDYNTYGINLRTSSNATMNHYSGNFWWTTGKYLKTIDTSKIDKFIRVDSESNYIQNGIDWKPFCAYESGINHYYEPYPKEKYRK